jgi:hypothetical protein
MRLMSRGVYIGTRVLAVLMILLFIAIGVVCFAYWQRMGWAYKVVLTFLAILLAPSARDVRKIFRPYQRYVGDWERSRGRPT